MKKILSVILLILLNCTTTGFNIKIHRPAQEVLWGIKKLAISKFKSESDITSLLASKLGQTQFFDVFNTTEIENILQKRNLTKDDLKNIDKSKEICTVLGIDGIIFGEITNYQIVPDEQKIEKVSKQVWTGKYERDEDGKIIEEYINGQLVKKKRFEERIIDQQYRIRKGTVSIIFNLVDGNSGKLAISTTMTKTYDSGKVPEEESKSLPLAEQILNDLANKVVSDFVKYISPKIISVKRKIESGEGFIEEGEIYATSFLWQDALDTWLKAEKAFPNNPAVYYNIGLAYEAQGEYDEAELYYRKAILLNKKKLYEKALMNLRKARELKEKKLKEINSG